VDAVHPTSLPRLDAQLVATLAEQSAALKITDAAPTSKRQASAAAPTRPFSAPANAHKTILRTFTALAPLAAPIGTSRAHRAGVELQGMRRQRV
jgi:hypothetical protein